MVFRRAVMMLTLSSAALAVPQGASQGQPGSMQGGSIQGPSQPQAQPQKMSPQAMSLAPKDTKEVLQQLHHINQQEVELAQLAEQKATSQAVKDFARQMMTDHQQMDQQLQTLASQQKVQLTTPKAQSDAAKKMQAAEKASLERLQALPPEMFDAAYMAEMVMGHDAAIFKLTAAQQQVKSQEVKTPLQDTLTRITSHRDQAYQVLGQVKVTGTGQPGVGGSGSQNPMQRHQH